MKVTNEDIVTALLTHRTRIEAAEALGIHINTLTRRTHTDAFKRLYDNVKKDLLEATSNKLIQANDSAIETLIDLLDSPNDSCRLGAAQKILTYSKDYFTFSNLNDRLQQIEQAIGERL